MWGLMSKQRRHVFIVDDDRSFGRSLKRLIDLNGYFAHYFESAQSFLDSVPSGQKGTAIVDMHMPGKGGVSLIDMMRDMHYTMPVILITGQTQADSRDIGLQHGARGFLQKPFYERSVLDLLESLEMDEIK